MPFLSPLLSAVKKQPPYPFFRIRPYLSIIFKQIASFSLSQSLWQREPALLYGLAALFGHLLSQQHFVFLFPFLILLFTLTRLRTLIRTLLVFFLFFYLGHTRIQIPEIAKEGIQGEAFFSIQSISSKKKFGSENIIYQGIIHAFTRDKKEIGRHLLCSVLVSSEKSVKKDATYMIKGKLKKSFSGYFSLKPELHEEWKLISYHLPFAEYRFFLKEKFKQFLKNSFESKLAAPFLSGLLLGEMDDPLLYQELSRFGLQHILAISGFHFSLIAAILYFLVRWIIPYRFSCSATLLLLFGYGIFMGPKASILRAWISISIYFVGQLLGKEAKALNSMGISILFLLLYDPSLCHSLGFVLSFSITASILLFFPLFDLLLQRVLIKRSLKQVSEMNLCNQHGYVVLSYLRQGFALLLAVNITALPLLLYISGKFPLMSFAYNLFFPFCVSFSLFLLLLGLLLFWLPFFASIIHLINNHYTHALLQMVVNMPPSLDFSFKTRLISLECVIVFLTLLFLYGLCMHTKKREKASSFVCF